MSEWKKIGEHKPGEGVYISFHSCRHNYPDPSGCLVRFGGELEDDGFARQDEGICVGGISWCPECHGATWDLKSLDPLHVEPSVACRTHSPDHHGFIRGGVWVRA
jgi:hypothetical protein